jgi:His-Xaa-Ser system protein HxsD
LTPLKNAESNIAVPVDLHVYSQSAILRATYKFTDKWYVQLTKVTEETVTVLFTPKEPGNHSVNLRGEFLNELLDQRLREQIGSETVAVRNLIMAHALSKLNLIPSTNDSDDSQPGS